MRDRKKMFIFLTVRVKNMLVWCLLLCFQLEISSVILSMNERTLNY